MSKKKIPFTPINKGVVKLYVCGPTVYNYLHIGNFRGAIFFNLVRNWLERLGNKVSFVYNYTDVDDKIINKAKDEGKLPLEISEFFIKEYEQDFKRLELTQHDFNPKVSDYINEIIKFIQDLVDNGSAYVIEGEVFFEINTFDNYGKLSGKVLEDLEAGQRVEVDERKKNPFDFVLWKPSNIEGAKWSSPWGEGRPGWHIECSAMIQEILGDTIDIHGGGVDLIFPHHENEVCQGEGRTSKTYCNYWMHNNFLNMKDEKMSKSLGNIITGRSFMDKWHPEILKFLMLSSHYRAILNMSDEKIHYSISGLARVYSALRDAEFIRSQVGTEGKVNKKFQELLSSMDKKIETAMNDDFNTVEVIAYLFEVVRSFNSLSLEKKLKDANSGSTADYFICWIKSYGSLMALYQNDPPTFLEELDNILLREKGMTRVEVDQIVEERESARSKKDFQKSDELRDLLLSKGILVFDNLAGRSWEVKK